MAPKQMAEAVPEEEYERMDKGLPPIKKPPVKMEDPVSPKVEGRLDMEKIPIDDVVAVLDCKRRSVRNEKHMIFIGYDLSLQLKKGTVSGWVPESDFINFKRSIGTRVNTSSIEL